jgi:hypothetical protein
MMAKPKQRPVAPVRIRLVTASSLRMVVLAAIAVGAAAYAIARHRTHPFEPMMVPRPAATELPAPELIPAD